MINFFSSHPGLQSGASALKGQSLGGGGPPQARHAPFLKSAPESPSTTYECLSLSLNQKQEGEDLELAGAPPLPAPHPEICKISLWLVQLAQDSMG